MRRAAFWTVVALVTAAVATHGSCRAGENIATARNGIFGALVGAAVPAAELSAQHGRGIKNINVDTSYTVDSGASLSAGAVKGNAVIGTSDTGMITTTGSINNNTGITTVFQNTGNNSLFQQTTSIYITVH